MEIFQVLSDPILPVFAVLAIGFGMGRAGVASVAEARVVNRFAMTIPVPILLFGLLADAPVGSFSLAPLAVYAASQAIVFSIGFLLTHRLLKRELGEAILIAFCGMFVNHVFYVLPISILIYGADNVVPVTSVITWDSVVIFGSAMIALQVIKLGRASFFYVLKSLAKTPMLQAIVLGLVVNLADMTLPGPVETFIEFNGVAAAPVALFAMGIVLSQTTFEWDAAVAAISLLKLLLFPAVVWAGLMLLPAGGKGSDMFLLLSAGPAGAMAFSLALLYDVRTESIVQIIFWTSILTLFTLAFLA